jgi:hypothetical protein
MKKPVTANMEELAFCEPSLTHLIEEGRIQGSPELSSFCWNILCRMSKKRRAGQRFFKAISVDAY